MNSDIYNYESPITRIQNKLLAEMVNEEEDQFTYKVRHTIGYQIDKAELIKALNYDRNQYEKGYQAGKLAAMRKGQWLINEDGYYLYCSICKNEPQNSVMTKYCPNCGAKMERGDEAVKNEQKVIITTDGKTTTARMFDGKKLIKSATAKCNPMDEFDFETGAKLAFDRLLNKEKSVYYNGIVKCMK